MINSLRARLLASYVVVLLLTLVVIAVALVVLLQAQPVPNELIAGRLEAGLQSALLYLDGTGFSIPQEGPTNRLRVALNQNAKRNSLRILILNANGIVTYDSQNQFKVSEQISIIESANIQTDNTALVRGTFRDAKGTNWLYVRQAVPPDAPNAQLLAFATPIPRVTLAEIIKYYGSAILVPLAQAGLIGLIVAFLFALVIARSVARPLQELADTARAIAEGHLDRRAPVRGPSEVRTVAETFNQMTQQVAESQQVQRDFLANVSHDLRTPLTSIKGFSQAIIEGVASNPQSAQRAAQIIYEEAARMYRMVEELLDLARVEAGRLNMTRHVVKIGEVVCAVGERLLPQAQDKGLTLNTEISGILPNIAGDEDRLSQVFTNLVENAIKHTPTGGTVTLRAQTQDNGILITVHDTGEGIPAEDLPRVFERFYQVDKSRQHRAGVGLGLTITQQIINAHKGRIWAESEDGAWTQFNVWLPLPAADSTTIARRRADLMTSVKPQS